MEQVHKCIFIVLHFALLWLKQHEPGLKCIYLLIYFSGDLLCLAQLLLRICLASQI